MNDGIWAFELNLTLKVNFNQPQNNRDIIEGVLHLLSEFVGSSWDGWWVIAGTSSARWLTLTHTHIYIYIYIYTVNSLISGAPHPKTEMFLVSPCSCLCPIHWSQVLSREWRCTWSSAGRRCSNYIRVINKFIARSGASYIEDLTVYVCIYIYIYIYIIYIYTNADIPHTRRPNLVSATNTDILTSFSRECVNW